MNAETVGIAYCSRIGIDHMANRSPRAVGFLIILAAACSGPFAPDEAVGPGTYKLVACNYDSGSLFPPPCMSPGGSQHVIWDSSVVVLNADGTASGQMFIREVTVGDAGTFTSGPIGANSSGTWSKSASGVSIKWTSPGGWLPDSLSRQSADTLFMMTYELYYLWYVRQ